LNIFGRLAGFHCLVDVFRRKAIYKFEETIEYIVAVLKEAGYDPYEQLYAYASTGNEAYITRKGDARKLASKIDRNRMTE